MMNISLKSRLLLVIMSVLIVTLFAVGFLQVHSWRQAVRSEVDSNLNLAKRLVGSNLFNIEEIANKNKVMTDALQGLRHVRVIVTHNYQDHSKDIAERKKLKEAGVPLWFVRLIYPYKDPLPKIAISTADLSSRLVIEADPSDELIEVWGDFYTQIIGIILFSIFIAGLIYTGLYYGLRPLNALLRGFERLEQGYFDVQLNEDVAPELSRINQKFNHTVSVLKKTSADNSMLTRKMVALQEEERKNLTRELHDETAPHLFGIRVAAAKARSLLKDKDIDAVAGQLTAIDTIVENLQGQTRRLLTRLRPLILDDLSMQEALFGLVKSKEIAQMDIKWDMQLERLDNIEDDTINVSLYRIIQECITNIVRHANASAARVMVSTSKCDKPSLQISVEDDGDGLSSDASHGFGLMGMQERVNALGGRFALLPSKLGGLKVMAEIPLG